MQSSTMGPSSVQFIFITFMCDFCEYVWIECDQSFADNKKKLIIGSVYRSPSSPVSEFLSNLDQLLHKLSFENKHVVLVRDININLLDTESNICAAYTNCFSGFGYESLLTVPTRYGHQGSQSLLDHILCNFSPSPDAGVVHTYLTDHFPVYLAFNVAQPSADDCFFTSVLDREKFIDAITRTDWSSDNCELDPEVMLQKFCALFLKAVSSSTKTVKCKKRYKFPHNPWITDGLLTSIRKKDNLYKKKQKTAF